MTIINSITNTKFYTRLTGNKMVQTVLDVILNRTSTQFNTNLFTRLKINNTINTNLATKLVSYTSIVPKSLSNIIVYKDSVELLDIDYSSLKIQFNLNSTPSEASFNLARHHDDFDNTLLGVSSIISAQNKITIYDGAILLFTGYITQISLISSSDTVGIVAQDVRYKINRLSMTLNYGGKYDYDYHVENYDDDTSNDIVSQEKSATYTPIERLIKISTSQALDLVFIKISTLITGHDTVDFGFIPEFTTETSSCGSLLDTLINNSANINWYIDENEYLRFQKIETGSLKTLPLSGINVKRHIYDTILNDITLNRISTNYFTSLILHLGQVYTRTYTQSNISAGVSYPDDYRIFPDTAKDITHYAFQYHHTNNPLANWLDYCGTERTSIYSYVPVGLSSYMKGWFTIQWLSKDEYTTPATTIIGTGSIQKDLYLTTYGKKLSGMYWKEQTDLITEGHWLCEVEEERYDYTAYAIDAANFELNQNNKLITEATVTLILDAFEYYGITLKDLINLSNTISTGCYANNNGFPLNISGISIDCATRMVTLNLTNYGKTYYQRIGDYMANYQPATVKQIMLENAAYAGPDELILGF
jgi:hypothetical protein